MKFYDIRGIANQWFYSYLTNTKQYISIDDFDLNVFIIFLLKEQHNKNNNNSNNNNNNNDNKTIRDAAYLSIKNISLFNKTKRLKTLA